MSNLTMPTLVVAFTQAAQTAVARSQKGAVALLLRDAAANVAEKHYSLRSAAQIPEELGTANQAAIRRAFLGGVNPPKTVLVCVIGAEAAIAADSACLNWLSTQKFDYLAGPGDLSPDEAAVLKTWVVNQRSDNHAVFKAVLPETAADSEAVVNFTAAGIQAGADTFDAVGYCGRVAGYIAGTPMEQSITYGALPEVTEIQRLTSLEMDAAVGAGKLILYHDGEKVKFGRGVNSLTTVTGKSDIWKKIKIVELLDMVQQDIRLTVQDHYIGRFPNTYDNKVLLITAISAYFRSLARDGLIGEGYTIGIDVDANTAWLEGQGKPTADMSQQEIREADTGTNVFLTCAIQPVDAMEDVTVKIDL